MLLRCENSYVSFGGCIGECGSGNIDESISEVRFGTCVCLVGVLRCLYSIEEDGVLYELFVQ